MYKTYFSEATLWTYPINMQTPTRAISSCSILHVREMISLWSSETTGLSTVGMTCSLDPVSEPDLSPSRLRPDWPPTRTFLLSTLPLTCEFPILQVRLTANYNKCIYRRRFAYVLLWVWLWWPHLNIGQRTRWQIHRNCWVIRDWPTASLNSGIKPNVSSQSSYQRNKIMICNIRRAIQYFVWRRMVLFKTP